MIKSHITYVDFNSRDEELHLIQRKAPSPDEYESVLAIPNRNGVLDFSHLDGERKFKNRDITYEFTLFNTPYNQRSALETRYKRKLMIPFNQPLRETQNIGYFWLGKCKSVIVDDGQKFNTLDVKIVFNVYPFLYQELDYFNDIWNDFNFEHGASNYTAYEIDGEHEIILYNSGDNKARPIIQLERL